MYFPAPEPFALRMTLYFGGNACTNYCLLFRPFKTQFPAIICTKDLVERAVFYKYFVEGKQIRVACYKSNRSCYKFESGLLQIRHELLQIRVVCYKSNTNCYKFEWLATNPIGVGTKDPTPFVEDPFRRCFFWSKC